MTYSYDIHSGVKVLTQYAYKSFPHIKINKPKDRRMPNSKTTEANRTYGSIVLRGGRMTKWKGKAASLSPSLGQLIASVSPVALGRALMVGANRTATAAVLGGAGLIVTTSGVSADCTLGDPGVYT